MWGGEEEMESGKKGEGLLHWLFGGGGVDAPHLRLTNEQLAYTMHVYTREVTAVYKWSSDA